MQMIERSMVTHTHTPEEDCKVKKCLLKKKNNPAIMERGKEDSEIQKQERQISDLQQEPLVSDHSARVPVDDLREGKLPTITEHDGHTGCLHIHTHTHTHRGRSQQCVIHSAPSLDSYTNQPVAACNIMNRNATLKGTD